MYGNGAKTSQNNEGAVKMNTNINKIDNKGFNRITRGSSWGFDADHCEVGYVFDLYPDLRSYSLGFRITKTKEEKDDR
jgi:formylglycine-generating enzyme required for sulfatase activity